MEKNKLKGDATTWRMVSNQPEGAMTMTGRVAYQGDSFEGESKTRMPNQGMETHDRSGLTPFSLAAAFIHPQD